MNRILGFFVKTCKSNRYRNKRRRDENDGFMKFSAVQPQIIVQHILDMSYK